MLFSMIDNILTVIECVFSMMVNHHRMRIFYKLFCDIFIFLHA